MVVVQRPVFPTIAENFRGTITSGMKKRQGQPEPKYVGPESSTMAKLAKEPPIIKAAQCLGFCTIAMNLKAPLTSCTLRKSLGQACKGDALEPSSMAKLVEEPTMEEAQRLGFRTTAENSRSCTLRSGTKKLQGPPHKALELDLMMAEGPTIEATQLPRANDFSYSSLLTWEDITCNCGICAMSLL